MVMQSITSREIQLASHPHGIPTHENFHIAQTTLGYLQDQDVLVRNHFMSVDPYMRGRMNPGQSYVTPFKLGQPLEGGAVGEVIESRAAGFTPGEIVTSRYGWREYYIAQATQLQHVDPNLRPLSAHLGVLGMTGLTACVGLNLAQIKVDDVIYISGAAGAVGNVAGQLAKIRGCRVIGSAGSEPKVTTLRTECGFDVAFNYKSGSISEQLALAAPEGIDVYFDNIGGETLEAALTAMRPHGRIIMCGGISGYNAGTPRPGPANLFNITTKRLTMQGMIVGDWMDRQAEFTAEVGGYYRTGRLKNLETVETGLDHAIDAFIGLFYGQNMGKMVVKLI